MEEFKVIDRCLMVKMPEEIDHYKSSYICEETDKRIMKEEVDHVIFDFEGTRFMDSSGIGILMGRYKKMQFIGGKVMIIHPDKLITRMLHMAGINRYIEIME